MNQVHFFADLMNDLWIFLNSVSESFHQIIGVGIANITCTLSSCYMQVHLSDQLLTVCIAGMQQ